MPFNTELTIALDTAIKAGKRQLEFQHKCLSVEIKKDHSPVTEVDKLCENFIRERLLGAFPDDGFMGEESGSYKGSSNRCWIVDPLDGTRPFIRGIPTHSVLISLEENHEPVVGVIHLPAMNITCWGAKNSGAFLNGEKNLSLQNRFPEKCNRKRTGLPGKSRSIGRRTALQTHEKLEL
jgi:fructose-1,6-bisphosphatase/inositol monophosphatase family enzyme